jgi:DNA-binding response OmpR family regulator
MLLRIGQDLPRPDVLLLDMNLPRRTGGEILSVMRQQKLCAGVPVVMLTSSDSPADRQLAADYAVDWYFRKPSDLTAFVQLGELVKGLLQARGASAAEAGQ